MNEKDVPDEVNEHFLEDIDKQIKSNKKKKKKLSQENKRLGALRRNLQNKENE